MICPWARVSIPSVRALMTSCRVAFSTSNVSGTFMATSMVNDGCTSGMAEFSLEISTLVAAMLGKLRGKKR